MAKESWSGTKSRRVVQRIVVEGDLVLQTPAHFGNGDTDALTDMPLLSDLLEPHRPLLTGASLAGALRSYLREREHGHAHSAGRTSSSVALFGGLKGDAEGLQSPLIVEDALGQPGTYGVELRDGVALAGKCRTAAEDKLYNLELWQAGTLFPLRFELLIREQDDAGRLKQALATALHGLASGEITLGARKRRGYGRVLVTGWRVKAFAVGTPAGLIEYLGQGAKRLQAALESDIVRALGAAQLLEDRRASFALAAEFVLDGSLLIRGGGGLDDQGPDMVHLHARQAAAEKARPVLSGTSLAGALRARALRIAQTMTGAERAAQLVDGLFGRTERASRVTIEEHVLTGVEAGLVQNRVSIDRFTGGARATALFEERPAFGGAGSCAQIVLHVANPEQHEIGLLLMVLKDLWTGDLPLGGEIAVGRGRLAGTRARCVHRREALEPDAQGERPMQEVCWEFRLVTESGRLEVQGAAPAWLQTEYVDALNRYWQEVQV